MPRLTLQYKNEKRQQVPHLVFLDDPSRFYGRVRSSNRKQGDAGLLELIKSEIRKRGFYDPELLDNRSREDVS